MSANEGKDPRKSLDAEARLPDVARVLARVLERVAERDRALLIALAERLAAERYRGWAEDPAQRSHRVGLLACADREEEIARRVESLRPGAEQVQRDLVARHPDLLEINRELFAGRPLEEQFAIQARGERLGAATWRSLAKRSQLEAERETLLGCALLEEESAAYLESLSST
jgi:hypothetical protein